MGVAMNAKIKGIYLIVECPYCHKPQVLFKLVWDNSVDNILKPRYFECEYCNENCFVELKETKLEV